MLDDVTPSTRARWAEGSSRRRDAQTVGGIGHPRQRISVARGLYREAPLVVADEPTAAMDARAEHAVFTHLRGLSTADPDRRGRITGQAAGTA